MAHEPPYETIEDALAVVNREARGVLSQLRDDVCAYCFRSKGPGFRLQNSLELISDATRPEASLLHHVVGQPKIRNTFTLQRLGAASIVIMPIARRIEAAKSDFGGPSTPIGQQPAA